MVSLQKPIDFPDLTGGGGKCAKRTATLGDRRCLSQSICTTSSTPTITVVVSKHSAASHPTNASANAGQANPNDSNSIRTIKCRD